jgi:putative spermidine/putrescine transport system permease protein
MAVATTLDAFAPNAANEPPRTRLAVRSARMVLHIALAVGLTGFILGPLLVLFVFAFAQFWFFPDLLPQSWTLHWWAMDLGQANLGQAIVYSFEFAPVVTLATAAVCLPTAYAFARYVFPGRRAALISILAINSFPKMGIYISLAGFFYSLNLIGTFAGVVIVQMLGTIVNMVWIPAAAFAGVPRELEEASRDVGAGPIRTFFRVTLVQALPGIVVALILTFLGSLDDAQGTYLIGAPKFLTMPVIMYSLVNGYPEQAAAVFAILLTVPSILLLLTIRRFVFGDAFAKSFRLY